MTNSFCRPSWFVALYASLVIASASPPVIGVARSQGSFRINHAFVPGTATILDGASIETTNTSSNLNLRSGERVLLASSSSATIHRDRLTLDRGAVELSGSSLYQIETGSIRVGASGPDTHIRVAAQPADRVNIAAVGGTAEVRNSQGVLLARIPSGMAVQVQSANPSAVQITGTVQTEGGRFFITDETSKVKFELRGSNLKNLTGKRVRVAGSALAGVVPAAGASQVVTVTQATVITAAGAAGGPAAVAAVSHGVPRAAIIVLGAAAGGTLGGLYAADVIGGDDTPVSR